MTRFSGLSKRERGILQQLYLKAEQQEFTCSNPKCLTKSKNIGCHVLQQNGILSELSDERGHIWELDATDFFNEQHVRFSYQSIKNSRTFKFYGFCAACDNSLFKEIEANKPNLLSSYRHQLLFTYRSVAHELDKVKRNLVFYENVFASGLPDAVKGRFVNQRESFKLSQLFLHSKKKQLEKEVYPTFFERILSFVGRKQKNYFYSVEIDRLEIVVSGTYSNPLKINTSQLEKIEVPIHYIHAIPQGDKSIVVFGCSSDNSRFFTGIDYKSICLLGQDKIQTMITDVILQRVETWGISKKLYIQLKQSNFIDRVLKAKNSKIKSEEKLNPTSLNCNIFTN